jgi:hypothetical protein
MKIGQFTLIELLETRKWLVRAVHSTEGVVPISKEQFQKAKQRLVEVDKELAARVIDGKEAEPLEFKEFKDSDFHKTLKELKLEDAEIEKLDK